MSEKYILALDQGTTSSRAIIFDKNANIIASSAKEFRQIYPQSGYVEHDPFDIWNSQLTAAREALKKSSLSPDCIAAAGITNQRETVVLWERATGKPVHNAIVWQCRRTADICAELEKNNFGSIIRRKTGLLLDPYFTATKIKWLFDNIPGLRERAEKGEIAAGTIDSWLLFNLTGAHCTDPTNASRTLLFNIETCTWDKELLGIFDIPESILPEIKASSSYFATMKKEILGAEIPVTGIAGDQQASLFGQACFEFGSAKNTYGTGCFMLVNTGKKPVFSSNRLLTTLAWDLGDGPEYALEGSVFVAGAAIQWLRDGLQIIKYAGETEDLARSVNDSGGVFLVPAFVGLGAPYWDPAAKGALLGLSRGSSRAHIARAALESIAYQSYELIEAIQDDIGQKVFELKADGGASENSFLLQFQSDIAGIPVIKSSVSETTALGAAYLAGLNVGYWNSKDDIVKNWRLKKTYSPSIDAYQREKSVEKWRQAIASVRMFKPA